MKNFFLSLKTSVWTLLVLICLFFIGSYMMPAHREVFLSINDDILFSWAKIAASDNLWYTWWFFGAFAALTLLTVNTLVCSIQAIRDRWSRTDFLRRISPQIVHAGFLFILLAHLLGAGGGYKLSGMVREGTLVRLPENRGLYLKAIHVDTDARGYMRDWTAEATVFENEQPVKSGTLGPNTPLFVGGTGIYLKSLSFERGPAALLVVARDPGAMWAFAGGLMFMAGGLMILTFKWKKV
jgi:hypothetical protein